MVLFQVPITGLTNSRISANVPCPFYGKYRVKFLNYAFTYSPTNPNILLKINSNAFWGNYAGGQLIVGSNPAQYVVFNTSKYEFESELNGYIDLDITALTNNTVPSTSFLNCYFSFDFEKI
jgi:hypothetical protein